MKKRKVITIIFLIIPFVACFCSACDFIQYVEKPENNVVSDEVKVLQEEYVDKLYTVTSEIKYREKEQKLYEYAVQDAVNELYECRSESELKQVYEKHLIEIGKIKTDKEYSDEEEVNAINAYRVAILGQAEESYDKLKYTEEQITYFNTVFTTFSGELFETTDREVMNELLQKLYFDIHKEDEILSLINYVDISTYEDSQKKILTETLDKCIENIRNFDKQENIDEIKEIYKFEVYKRNTVKKLNEYVDLQLYRNEQVAEIKAILTEHLKLAEEVETNIEADNVFREYQIAVYDITTDEMLYSEELAELKAELSSSLSDSYKLSFYRENEGQTIQELLTTFQDILKTLQKKEDVLSQYVIIKSRLDSVKTAKVLDEEDRVNLIEELYVDLQNRIEKNIDGVDKDEFLLKAGKAYADMQDRISLDSVRAVHRVLANEISAKFGAALDIIKEELSEYNNSVYYRENEQNEVNSLKEEYLSKLIDDIGIEEAKVLLQEAKLAIEEIKTNDDLWDDSVEKFRSDLKSLYGEAVLEEPRSLTEANDYFELANIIDYYAFYQLSGTEFVCDTFRVKLNFDHNDATWERNEVYWYCELLKSAVDIKAEFEGNSDFFVITLIPYHFASVSNNAETEKIKRSDNLVEFNSDKTEFIDRDEEFDNFPYYNFAKTANVWNSQQLWYALEHGYVPNCAQGSPAEEMLNKAKSILRGIIKEGMSDEEKIFNIYSWFGRNVQYDHLHTKYDKSSDRNNLPNEVISSLQSHFVEGALNDGLAVCIGYAKTYLLLLRIEGIEAKFDLARMSYMEGNNTINSITGSFHGYVLLKLNGAWYYSDPQKTSAGTQEEFISLPFLCLPKEIAGFYEVMNVNLESSNSIFIYEKLSFNGYNVFVKNKDELYKLLDEFYPYADICRLSILYDTSYKDCFIDLIDFNKHYNVGRVNGNNVINELIISSF